MNKYLEIGQIVNTFGIKGEVKVNPFTEDSTKFERLHEILLEKSNKQNTYEIENVKYHKNTVILKLKGVNTPEEAEKLRNSYIKIDRKFEEPLPEGTYYIADLIGLEVYTDENIKLGKVDDIYNHGSCDIYVVKDELGKQILLPAIDDVLKEIDLENEKIVVHIIPGLL